MRCPKESLVTMLILVEAISAGSRKLQKAVCTLIIGATARVHRYVMYDGKCVVVLFYLFRRNYWGPKGHSRTYRTAHAHAYSVELPTLIAHPLSCLTFFAARSAFMIVP